ncbi:MAG: hypothetical protein O7C59_03670 [Rickettsia endosymbiont of Ixodes persulcatus]|nr:hypothetical protein [Rickettsia endosymbiont of Ixodes persulcatus]
MGVDVEFDVCVMEVAIMVMVRTIDCIGVEMEVLIVVIVDY